MSSLAEQPASYHAPQRELWSHEFLDALSLAYYQEIANRVRTNPSLIEVAKTNIAHWKSINEYPDSQLAALKEWESVLDERHLEQLLCMMTDPSTEGIRQRQSGPFAGVLTDLERKQIKENLKKSWKKP